MKTKKKFVKYGWMPRSNNIPIFRIPAGYGSDRWMLGYIDCSKGESHEWDQINWPPRKVKITVEFV